jgi:aspartyl-tRNA(Asn)/glutamyl-tRNA(Gln) amidotransferase subunit C
LCASFKKDLFLIVVPDGEEIEETLFTLDEIGDEIDEIIIAQRINSIGLSFEDNLNPSDYIKSLALRKVPAGNLVKTAKELKKFSIRREILNSSQDIAKAMKSMSPESSYQQIVECADAIYNSKINLYEIGKDVPENIYADMEEIIEERGNNPITEFGMMGPHEKLNNIYGSLLRPGNITVVVARSGVGKTQFCMHYATKVSAKYNVPVLHFDNGEMSEEELVSLASEFTVILEAVARVQEVASADVPPTSHPLPLRNVFRPDVTTPSLTPEEALSEAPASEEQRFRVPQILGEEA